MKKFTRAVAVLLLVLFAVAAPAGVTGGRHTGNVATSLLAITGYTSNDALQIVIRADPANTGVIYLGRSTVTAAGANAWMFLEASDAVTLGYGGRFRAGLADAYLIGSDGTQTVFVTVLTP